MIRIAIPNKGRLNEPTVKLLKEAGLPVSDGGERKLFGTTTDPEISFLFARAADIPEYVQDGAADIGITGIDLVSETDADVDLMLDLNYGKSNLMLAVPEDSSIESVEELEGMKIGTEFPNITKKFFDSKNINIEVIKVSGACEMTPYIGVADAIVDISSSGTTFVLNNLKPVEKVFSSSVYMIANHQSAEEKNKIHHIKTAFESVLNAEGKRYLMMNVPKDSLDEVKEVLPGLSGPTVMKVESESSTLAIHAVVDSDMIFTTVNKLKEVGARDILVVPIERLMP
ncbi:ATP phosphoribosyltransferase [Methanohalobium sp.]|uniref:ATP phosphoribosyltransferase n=1 Tax=Methanohalobium sp. TaxID=2837493 RepID=UPI0025E0514A|nr:ATP phosphoribosyltransferase [Methanohalobium sp.]